MKDKERAVYEAVGRLVLSGHVSSQLTVSAIAREAGVGKGTVYGYFTTKEELIAKALSYNLQSQAEQLLRDLRKTPAFDAKVLLVLERIDVMSEAHRFLSDAFAVLTQRLDTQEHEACLRQFVFPILQRILEDLRQGAVRSGLIAKDAPEGPTEYALLTVLAGYCFICCMPEMAPQANVHERRQRTVGMMRRVLAP